MSEITNKNLIVVNAEYSSKDEAIKTISGLFADNGFATDVKDLEKTFHKREKEFSTGLTDGFAIPHASTATVLKPQIAIVRLKKAIDWDSLDGKPTDMIIAIVVPKTGRNDHFEILTAVSKKLANPDFVEEVKKMDAKTLLKTFNGISVAGAKKEVKKENKQDNKTSKKEATKKGNDKYVVGVTACSTGIAHTYMAEQKLIKAAEEMGWNHKIETQGSDGVKNKLSMADLQQADAIVVSTAVRLEDQERFDEGEFAGKVLKRDLQPVIKDPVKAIKDAEKIAKDFNKSYTPGETYKAVKATVKQVDKRDTKTKISEGFSTGMKHVMTGISHMLPVLVLSGLLLAIANIGGLAWTIPDKVHIGSADWVFGTGAFTEVQNGWVQLMYYMNSVGSVVLKFMYPMFAMYLAYSIAGKLALIPGFMGGLLASGLQADFTSGSLYASPILSWAYPDGFIPSAFFGAITIGFLVGALAKWLNTNIKVKKDYITLKTMLIIPLILSVFVFFFMEFAVNPAFGALNNQLRIGFSNAGDAGAYGYGSVIALGTAFDLGGPFNKAAGAIANGFNADAMANPALVDANIFNLTGRTMAIIIPPIGIGLAASMGNSITRKEIFTKEEKETGRQSSFLGLIGVSEGAIPFILKYPGMIFVNILGAVVGTNIALAFGSIQQLPLPAVWGWFLTGTTVDPIASPNPIGTQIAGYVIGVVVGVAIIAGIFIGYKMIVDRMRRENLSFSKYCSTRWSEVKETTKDNSVRFANLFRSTDNKKAVRARKTRAEKSAIRKARKAEEKEFKAKIKTEDAAAKEAEKKAKAEGKEQYAKDLADWKIEKEKIKAKQKSDKEKAKAKEIKDKEKAKAKKQADKEKAKTSTKTTTKKQTKK